MASPDFVALAAYAKAFSGLTPVREKALRELAPLLLPHLSQVTESFYATLEQIPNTRPYLEGRIDALKQTHQRWLEGVFSRDYDERYAADMYRVGEVHVKVNLPVEFMAGGVALIQGQLVALVITAAQGDVAKIQGGLEAVVAAMGFALIIMQESYQSSTLSAELEKFLSITGMSRTLFNNLAAAYKN